MTNTQPFQYPYDTRTQDHASPMREQVPPAVLLVSQKSGVKLLEGSQCLVRCLRAISAGTEDQPIQYIKKEANAHLCYCVMVVSGHGMLQPHVRLTVTALLQHTHYSHSYLPAGLLV